MSLANTKVSTKLYVGFSIPVILIIIVIAIGISNLATIEQNLDRIVKVNNARTAIGEDLATLVRENSIALRNMLLTKDTKGRQTEKDKITATRGTYDGDLKKLTEMTPSITS